MEYVSGGELYTLLEKKGKLPEREAKKYFYQILTAVEYSHNQKVVHRDIKPENVLLDEKKNIKLGDFGFCSVMRDGEFLTTACGSANYASPEVISSQKYSGAEADIWSLGVLLFTLLAGALPFDEASMPALMAKVKAAKYTIPYHFSTQATDLIQKMIVVNPLCRISIANIFHHPWISETYPLPPICLQKEIKIDEEIFSTLLGRPEFKDQVSTQVRINNILGRQSYDSFTVAYEMMLFTKNKALGLDQCEIKRVFKMGKARAQNGDVPCDWQYCIRVSSDQETTMILLCSILKSFNAKWIFLSPFYMKIMEKSRKLKVEIRLYEVIVM